METSSWKKREPKQVAGSSSEVGARSALKIKDNDSPTQASTGAIELEAKKKKDQAAKKKRAAQELATLMKSLERNKALQSNLIQTGKANKPIKSGGIRLSLSLSRKSTAGQEKEGVQHRQRTPKAKQPEQNKRKHEDGGGGVTHGTPKRRQSTSKLEQVTFLASLLPSFFAFWSSPFFLPGCRPFFPLFLGDLPSFHPSVLPSHTFLPSLSKTRNNISRKKSATFTSRRGPKRNPATARRPPGSPWSS
jgi:hypothetical protein